MWMVLSIDFDSKKCELARQFGAETVDLSKNEDPVVVAQGFSRGRGVDGVLITAATQSDEVMHQSAEMCRKMGCIVLVGVVGLNLRRDDFFKKGITFQVSASRMVLGVMIRLMKNRDTIIQWVLYAGLSNVILKPF